MDERTFGVRKKGLSAEYAELALRTQKAPILRGLLSLSKGRSLRVLCAEAFRVSLTRELQRGGETVRRGRIEPQGGP